LDLEAIPANTDADLRVELIFNHLVLFVPGFLAISVAVFSIFEFLRKV
jgi:hypothetical protein